MNLAITNLLGTRAKAKTYYATDFATGVTTYELTKDIDGKPVTVNVPVTALQHASHDAETIVELVVREAHELFENARTAVATGVKKADADIKAVAATIETEIKSI